jgi:hypothetical protein
MYTFLQVINFSIFEDQTKGKALKFVFEKGSFYKFHVKMTITKAKLSKFQKS